MDTKWNDIRKKVKHIWTYKRKEVAALSRTISLLGSLFFIGIILAQAMYREMSDILIVILLVLILWLINSIIWLSYLKVDEPLKQKSYQEKKVYYKKMYHKQSLMIVKYFGILIIIGIIGYLGIYRIRILIEDIFIYEREWILFCLLILFPISMKGIMYYHYKVRINSLQENISIFGMLIERLEQDKEGKVSNPFTEESIFYHWGNVLENIRKQTKEAIEQKIKGEKMKVELITNISHDLKTPLTSIVNYLDIIKKEQVSEEVKDYIELISIRVFKLKEMIESLFDLSKTATGNAEFTMETMEMNRLVEQIVADMEDSINTSDQIWKIDLTKEDTFFVADTSAMYRICQNLFENALKYSLKGTRVFVMTEQTENEVRLKIINTANYEMDFTKEDIVERFTRGDASRTTEGNGLGLAIAKTYTEACYGTFDIEVRGDQFYVELVFQNEKK